MARKKEPLDELLRRLIRDSGKSQLQLSKECGVKQQHLSLFLRGHDMGLKKAQLLIDYFGVKVRKD